MRAGWSKPDACVVDPFLDPALGASSVPGNAVWHGLGRVGGVMKTNTSPAFQTVSDFLVRRLTDASRTGGEVTLTLDRAAVREFLQWARVMRGLERAGIDVVKARAARKAAYERRRLERDAFWAGFRDRLGDLLIAYALTGITLWIIEAFWKAGGL